MAFVTDKSELKPDLILFRRGDVEPQSKRGQATSCADREPHESRL
jgi:hypothetical protein